MSILIANQAQLTAALSKAVGGETFLLKAGSYDAVYLSGRNFGATVTIRSADAANPARIEAFNISKSSNIALQALDVGHALDDDDTDFEKMITIASSRNISLDGLKVHGSLDGKPQNDGWGMLVRESADVRVSNTEFTELHRAAVFQRTTGLTVENNHFHHLRSDGAIFADVDNVMVRNNRFHDFFFKGQDHPDAIQFQTNGTSTQSTNITITGNQIFQGSGRGLQGIFMNDEQGHLPFKNVKIDNNIVYTSEHWHGIAVLGGDGVAITNNTVVSQTGDWPFLWIKVEDARGVTITRNVTDDVFVMPGTQANARDNLELRWSAADRSRIPNLDKGAATTVQDLLVDGYGYHPGGGSPSPAPTPSPAPSPSPSPAPPPSTGREVYGTAASETVFGTPGADIIYGVGKGDKALGDNSRDKLFGRAGADIFVLGDQRGAFYDNPAGTPSGRADFVQIMDFAKGDRIQLSGSASDYIFHRETLNGVSGTSIFKDNGNGRWDGGDELIGHVARTSLSAASKSALIFTGGGARSSAQAHAEPVAEQPDIAALHPEPVLQLPETPLFIDLDRLFGQHFAIA